MKARTKPKGFGIAATVLMTAPLAGVVFASAVSAGDVQPPRSPQTIDVTTKEVTLYHSPDPLDNTGEIYVRYNTNVAEDVDETTGTQVVIEDGQANTETATPNIWTGKPYAANSLRIRIYDEDVLSDDKLYNRCHSLSIGYSTYYDLGKRFDRTITLKYMGIIQNYHQINPIIKVAEDG